MASTDGSVGEISGDFSALSLDGRSKDESGRAKLQEIKVLVAGPADAGKSSTIGVLVHNELDDGKIFMKVDRYGHEHRTGTTSSVSNHYIVRDGKVVDLCNLCGQQKYLKHTLFGISGTYADFGMLLVSVNKGIGGPIVSVGDSNQSADMAIEHLSILVHLNIPFFVVITKLDICQSKDMYQEVHKQIHKQVKKFGRTPVSLKVDRNYNITENYAPYVDYLVQRTDIVPIISISNRTGKNLQILRDILFSLHPRSLWSISDITNNVFHITSVYQVKGAGLVFAGVVKSVVPVRLGDTWYVGPSDKGMLPVKIRSIHNNIRQDVDELCNGESGCLCIRFSGKDSLARGQIRRGMILTDNPEKIRSAIVMEFTARILVLRHHTSIRPFYESVVHLGPVRQAATISFPSDECLRTGDSAIVSFKWKFRPEFVEPNTRFFAREGQCRIAGEVIEVGISRSLSQKVSSSVEKDVFDEKEEPSMSSK